MKPYIDKDKLVAQIDKLMAETTDEDNYFYSSKAEAQYKVLLRLKNSIDYLDTLEVKDEKSSWSEEDETKLKQAEYACIKFYGGDCSHTEWLRKKLKDNLKIKTDKDNTFEKFKSLRHINKDLNRTLAYLGYAPNLYYFGGNWHVDWISYKEGDSIKGFSANTPEEAIDKAFNWYHSTFCNE